MAPTTVSRSALLWRGSGGAAPGRSTRAYTSTVCNDTARRNRKHSQGDRRPGSDHIPPVGRLACAGLEASRCRGSHWTGRRHRAAAVRFVAPGLGRWLGCGSSDLPRYGMADHFQGRRGTRRAVRDPRGRDARISATALLIGASVASLLGVGLALGLAGEESGTTRVLLIGIALVTVMLSWTVVNTVFTLRYAHLHYASSAGGIAFASPAGPEQPNCRDFAYVAFTIGMTYQVSDTTLHDQRIRRTVLSHALLAYVFGVVIVAGAINLVAGLIR